jgi:antitoxin component of MazEF toxin-antitoxin module
MNKGIEESLDFGTRKIQKIRHSYTVIIPKALVKALRLEPGDEMRFKLDREGGIVLQKGEDIE